MSNEQLKKNNGFGCVLWGCGGCLVVTLIITCLLVFAAMFFFSDSFEAETEHTSETVKIKTVSGFNRNSSQYVAVIPVHGIIMNGDRYSDGVVTPEHFSTMMDKAEEDPNVRGVVISIDSPGGEVNAADAVYRRIRAFRSKTKLPVVALMGSVAASGGYYVAAACDQIVAGEMTLTGSIGVIISSYNFTGLLKKIGVEGEVYKSGEMKDMLSPVKNRTEEERKIVQSLVDECYLSFARLVSRSRKMSLSKVMSAPIGDGRVYHGKTALSYGMVDQIGHLEDAVALCAKLGNRKRGSLNVKRYNVSPGFFAELFGVNGSLRNGLNLKVDLSGGNLPTVLKPGQLYFLPAGY